MEPPCLVQLYGGPIRDLYNCPVATWVQLNGYLFAKSTPYLKPALLEPTHDRMSMCCIMGYPTATMIEIWKDTEIVRDKNGWVYGPYIVVLIWFGGKFNRRSESEKFEGSLSIVRGPIY